MYAIRARYLGPTDHRGSRFVVTWGDKRATIPFDYAASRPSEAAIREALRSRRFREFRTLDGTAYDTLRPGSRLMFGTLREGGRNGYDGDTVAMILPGVSSYGTEPVPDIDRP